MSKQHSWPDYIIQKGLFLAALLLISALILSVWADAAPLTFPALRRYAAFHQDSALLVLSASLFGGLFLKEGLQGAR